MTRIGAATPSTATKTYTAIAPTTWPPGKAADAMAAAAATATTTLFGLAAPTASPAPNDRPVPNPAMPSIHFGMAPSSPARGRPRNFRTRGHHEVRPEGQLQHGDPGRVTRTRREVDGVRQRDRRGEHSGNAHRESDQEARCTQQWPGREQQQDHRDDVER